jgi:hypothetical protein
VASSPALMRSIPLRAWVSSVISGTHPFAREHLSQGPVG